MNKKKVSNGQVKVYSFDERPPMQENVDMDFVPYMRQFQTSFRNSVYSLSINGQVYVSTVGHAFSKLDGSQFKNEKVKKIATLTENTCVQILFNNGKVTQFNWNETYENKHVKDILATLPKIVDMACSGQNSTFVTEGGKLMTFGRNYWGATGTVSVISTPVELVVPNAKFIQVSGANNHYAAVTDNGELYTWGQNARGQCGHSIANYEIDDPRKVENIDPIRFALCTSSFTCAVSESRDLWIMGCTGAFGYKGFYLKGDIEQSFLRIYVPRKLELPNKEKVVQISAGKMHLIALSNKNNLYLWSYYSYKHETCNHGTWNKIENNHPIARLFSSQFYFGTYSLKSIETSMEPENAFSDTMNVIYNDPKRQQLKDVSLVYKDPKTRIIKSLVVGSKIVLMARSRVIRKHLSSLESKMDQLMKSKVEIEIPFEVEQATLSTFVRYLYTGVFSDNGVTIVPTLQKLAKHFDVQDLINLIQGQYSTRHALESKQVASKQIESLIAYDKETAMKNLCDIAFTIEGKTIYVHTQFLNNEPYFQTLLHSGLKETIDLQENDLNEPIEIVEKSFDSFNCVMHYIYSQNPKPYISVDNCIDIMLVAHEYAMKPLVIAATSVVISNIDKENVETVYQLAVRYGWKELVTWCLFYMANNIMDLPELETSTKRQLDFFLAN